MGYQGRNEPHGRERRDTGSEPFLLPSSCVLFGLAQPAKHAPSTCDLDGNGTIRRLPRKNLRLLFAPPNPLLSVGKRMRNIPEPCSGEGTLSKPGPNII